jgi:hypothetical protein
LGTAKQEWAAAVNGGGQANLRLVSPSSVVSVESVSRTVSILTAFPAFFRFLGLICPS